MLLRGEMQHHERLSQLFAYVRASTEALAVSLSPEDQLLQAMPDCSPTKWHRAHTTWFFEEFILKPRGILPVEPAYSFLFNSYYDAVGPRHPRPRRGMLSRPSCEEVRLYRQAVDARMLDLLQQSSEAELAALTPVLQLGLAHEEQHQELLLTDILNAFWSQPLQPSVRPASLRPALFGLDMKPEAVVPLRWHAYAGGVTWLGSSEAGFSFDNEGPRHRVFLEPFELASRPISVGEVRAFIDAGGYRTPFLWLSEGWAWVQQDGHSAPLYWRQEPGSTQLFGVDGWREALDDEPAAHLTYYEADAVARFLGARLPTEAEWEHAAASEDPHQGNFREQGVLRPLPAQEQGQTPGQLFGDVWEWTASAYSSYPGFAPAAGAIGEYNGKFMINQLVLRGGSCFSPRGHLRASYRNFWPAHTAFQMSGARLARTP